MKRNLAVILLLLFAFPTLSTAEETIRFDGNYWILQDRAFKIEILGVLVEGLYLGRTFSTNYSIELNDKDPCQDKIKRSFDEHMKPLSNLEQLQDALDTFYSDYRNRRILLRNGVYLVSVHPAF